MTLEKQFRSVIHVGDAGYPVDVTITIWYEENGDDIIITASEDEQLAMDNVPNWWPEKIAELIEDQFPDKKVIFK